MYKSDEGLGLSVAAYALALICGLALFVLPVYWLNSPTVYENPGVTAARLPGGPAYANHPAEFPLAKLQDQQIVSAAMLAELNANAKKEKPVRRASRPASNRTYAQAQHDDAPDYRPARRSLFFSLF